MTTPIETFTASRTTASGGTWSRTVRPSPLVSLGLVLAALLAIPIAILLVAAAIALVLLLAVLVAVRRLWERLVGGRPRRPEGVDPEGRVNVRIRRPEE